MSKKVAWDYIVPVVLPKDLKGVTPGKLPANLLVPAVGGGKLHHIAAKAWAAMVAAAKAEGIELKPTSAGDTYRDYETQKKGFLTRYQLEPIPGQSTKTFEGKTWYLKKGMAMLATPGKSQHNLGIAVDVHSASEPKRLNWLIANVKKFGFSWEVVPSEPWHLRYVCGDNMPEAVASFQGQLTHLLRQDTLHNLNQKGGSMKVHDIDRIIYYLGKVFVGPTDAEELFRVIDVLQKERQKLEKKHVKKQSFK